MADPVGGRQSLRGDRNRAALQGYPPARIYLLRGLLRCGLCGRKLNGEPNHGRRIYRCAGRDRLRGDHRCHAATWTAERLEAFVWETVVGVLRNPDLLTEKLESHRARLGAQEVEVRSAVGRVVGANMAGRDLAPHRGRHASAGSRWRCPGSMASQLSGGES
jgi:hypothetical protein